MTASVVLSLTIPDLETAPDEVIESILQTRDGRWSRQTKAMLAKAGVDRLALNDAWASTPTSWACPCCQRYKPGIARLTSSGQANSDFVRAVEDYWAHRNTACSVFHDAEHLHKRLGWSMEDVELTLTVERLDDSNGDPKRALDHIRWLIAQGNKFSAGTGKSK